jgi:hypothetical protein
VTLYGDRLTTFKRSDGHWTLAEQLRGAQDPTHFGRVLAELGIGFIQAQSPQAKGRIERLWETLQDRLVSELRLHAIGDYDAANAFLPAFLADFRRRFACAPASPVAAWRPAPRALDRLLGCRYARTVARDNTVQLGARCIPIPPGPGARSYARCRVEVRELLDGRALVFYQHALLATQPAPPGPFVLKPRQRPGDDRRLTAQSHRRRRAQLERALTTLSVVAHRRAPAGDCPSEPPARHPWRTTPFSRRELARQRSQPKG